MIIRPHSHPSSAAIASRSIIAAPSEALPGVESSFCAFFISTAGTEALRLIPVRLAAGWRDAGCIAVVATLSRMALGRGSGKGGRSSLAADGGESAGSALRGLGSKMGAALGPRTDGETAGRMGSR